MWVRGIASKDGGGNDGAATVASALVVMTTFFRNVPGLVRDVTQRRYRCRRRVAAVPHHNVEKTVSRRRSSSMAPLCSLVFHQDGSRAITGNAVVATNCTIPIVSPAMKQVPQRDYLSLFDFQPQQEFVSPMAV